jgi:methionyl-tRNA synthetase
MSIGYHTNRDIFLLISYAIYKKNLLTNNIYSGNIIYQPNFSYFFYLFKMTINRPASYFISTPIYYVNSKPHIGHLYSSLLADTIARWQIVKHRSPPKIIFSTGTDEHGLKIERAAIDAQLTPLEFCNQVSGRQKKILSEFFRRKDFFVVF